MIYEVIIDSGETPNKCTIAPIIHRPDFRVYRVQGAKSLGPLKSPVLLHHQGQCLSLFRETSENIKSIAVVDCIWNRLDSILNKIEGRLPMPVSIPAGFETAYPRKSKKGKDPTGGLATIEAMFIAAALLGNWDPTLLAEYHFREKFLDLNKKRFLELGVDQAGVPFVDLPQSPRPKNSLQRRYNRGKI